MRTSSWERDAGSETHRDSAFHSREKDLVKTHGAIIDTSQREVDVDVRDQRFDSGSRGKIQGHMDSPPLKGGPQKSQRSCFSHSVGTGEMDQLLVKMCHMTENLKKTQTRDLLDRILT